MKNCLRSLQTNVSSFRAKIDPNIQSLIFEIGLAAQHKQSFALIIEDFRVENVKSYLMLNYRDFDVLDEKLGRMRLLCNHKDLDSRLNHFFPSPYSLPSKIT